MFRHKKTGNIYTIVDTAINCTNSQDGQVMVIYKNNNDQIFVREIREFNDKFEKIEGKE